MTNRYVLAFLISAVVAVMVGYSVRTGALNTFTPLAQPGSLIPELTSYRVVFEPGKIIVDILNTGPVETSVANVQLGGSIPFSIRSFIIEPEGVIPRLGTARVTIPFNWGVGEPYSIKMIVATGESFVTDVAAALATPSVGELIPLAVMLGAYVGVIPVYLGIAPLPLFRRMKEDWLDLLAAFAVGVLVFLLVDTVTVAEELSSRLPIHLGATVFVGGFAVGLVGLILFGRLFMKKMSEDMSRESSGRGVFIATMIALGIGLHNLGEGLSIGAAYTQGLAAFATFLALGFGIHNLSEGVAIVSPVASRSRLSIRYPLLWGLLAGGPTIIGALIGFSIYTDLAAALFFALASASILYVVAEVIIQLAANPNASNNPKIYVGLLAGIFTMYLTSLLLNILAGGAS